MNLLNFFNQAMQWLFDAVIAVGIPIGAVFAYKKGFLGTAGETQSQAISAQKAMIDTQSAQIDTLEKDKERLQGVIETAKDLLAQKGITLIINGEMVSVDGANGHPSGIRRRPPKPPSKNSPP